MSGRLTETSITSLSDRHDEQQSTLGNFGCQNETAIAVVSRPTDEILDITDEWLPELGMPEKELEKFLKRRYEYSRNNAIDDAQIRAYNDLELDETYVEYVRNSDEAQAAIDDIVKRLTAGENIVLVCFESQHERCHRHKLREMIETRRQNNLSNRNAVIQ